jgi:hypothetical protein
MNRKLDILTLSNFGVTAACFNRVGALQNLRLLQLKNFQIEHSSKKPADDIDAVAVSELSNLPNLRFAWFDLATDTPESEGVW